MWGVTIHIAYAQHASVACLNCIEENLMIVHVKFTRWQDKMDTRPALSSLLLYITFVLIDIGVDQSHATGRSRVHLSVG